MEVGGGYKVVGGERMKCHLSQWEENGGLGCPNLIHYTCAHIISPITNPRPHATPISKPKYITYVAWLHNGDRVLRLRRNLSSTYKVYNILLYS